MNKAKRPKKAARYQHPTLQMHRDEIKTLRRISAQRKEISRLLRTVGRLAATVERDLLTFSLGVVQSSGRLVVEREPAPIAEP